jgi:hypothetical protein
MVASLTNVNAGSRHIASAALSMSTGGASACDCIITRAGMLLTHMREPSTCRLPQSVWISPRMAIGEFPDEKAAASAILAAAAGGSLSDIETTVAMTAKDAAATFGAAGKAAKEFRSAGRS